jgi:hypothetical protein
VRFGSAAEPWESTARHCLEKDLFVRPQPGGVDQGLDGRYHFGRVEGSVRVTLVDPIQPALHLPAVSVGHQIRFCRELLALPDAVRNHASIPAERA